MRCSLSHHFLPNEGSMLTRLLMVMGLFVLAAQTAWAASAVTWDRNTEDDMKDYNVYACIGKGCTVAQTAANLIGTVNQTTAGTLPTQLLPSGKEGTVAVSARDLDGNESGLSVSVPFDTATPKVPTGVRLK